MPPATTFEPMRSVFIGQDQRSRPRGRSEMRWTCDCVCVNYRTMAKNVTFWNIRSVISPIFIDSGIVHVIITFYAPITTLFSDDGISIAEKYGRVCIKLRTRLTSSSLLEVKSTTLFWSYENRNDQFTKIYSSS